MRTLTKGKNAIMLSPFMGKTRDETKEIRRGDHDPAILEAVDATGCVPEYVLVPEEYEGKNRRRSRAAAVAWERVLYLNINPRKNTRGVFARIGDRVGEDAQLLMFEPHLERWADAVDGSTAVRFFVDDEKFPITPDNDQPAASFAWRLFELLRRYFPGCSADWYNAWRMGRTNKTNQVVSRSAPSATGGCSLYTHSLELAEREYTATRMQALNSHGKPVAACVCMHGGYVWLEPHFEGRKIWAERDAGQWAKIQMRFQGFLTRNDEIVNVWGFRLLEDRSRVLLNEFVFGRNTPGRVGAA